jgi:hypothetical protein
MERDGDMNPAIGTVTYPKAVGGKLDLITFVSVPDRFAGPIHVLVRFLQISLEDLSCFVLAILKCLYDTDFSKHQQFQCHLCWGGPRRQ